MQLRGNQIGAPLAARLGLPSSPFLGLVAQGLAAAYGLGAKARRAFYRRRPWQARRLPAAVVSVGNLAVGGTGKTPLVVHLAREFTRRGLKVAVLSRGYGGRRIAATCLSDGQTLYFRPPEVGDEAYSLARELPGVPVYTGVSRYEAGLAAWRRHAPDLFLLDDGFQHFQVHRDLDLVLLDAESPLGNGLLLPAGPLREPPDILALADVLVLTRFQPERHQETLSRFTARFPHQDVLTASILPVGLRRFPGGASLPLSLLSETPCLAFAGLARPEVFLESLAALGTPLAGWRSFPDHHPYTAAELSQLLAAAQAGGAQALITTAKDWARLGEIWDAGLPLLVLEVAACLEPWEPLGARVEELVGREGAGPFGGGPAPLSPAEGPHGEPARPAPGASNLRGRGSLPPPPAVVRAWESLRCRGRPLPKREEVLRILLRAPNWLGDAVMALPVMAALRKRFPQASISVMAAPRVAPLFAGHPLVAETLSWPAGPGKLGWYLQQRGKFDLGVALPNSFAAALSLFLAGARARVGYAADGRSLLLTRVVLGREALQELHTVYYYLGVLRAFGEVGEGDLTVPRVYLAPAEVREAGELLERLGLSGQGPLVGLAPGAAYGPAKRWPADRFAQVARELTERAGACPVLLGGPEDRESAAAVAQAATVPLVDLAGRTTLRQALAVLARLAVLVTNDSGLMHAAAALGVPVVAVFGSTNPRATGPFTPRATVISHPPACSPCLARTCAEDYACLTAVSAAEVAAAALQWIQISQAELASGATQGER